MSNKKNYIELTEDINVDGKIYVAGTKGFAFGSSTEVKGVMEISLKIEDDLVNLTQAIQKKGKNCTELPLIWLNVKSPDKQGD